MNGNQAQAHILSLLRVGAEMYDSDDLLAMFHVPEEADFPAGVELSAVDEDDYCPVTFDSSVPSDLNELNPVVLSGVHCFVYLYDGYYASYVKFHANIPTI